MLAIFNARTFLFKFSPSPTVQYSPLTNPVKFLLTAKDIKNDHGKRVFSLSFILIPFSFYVFFALPR